MAKGNYSHQPDSNFMRGGAPLDANGFQGPGSYMVSQRPYLPGRDVPMRPGPVKLSNSIDEIHQGMGLPPRQLPELVLRPVAKEAAGAAARQTQKPEESNAIPQAPPGVSLDGNIRRVQQHMDSFQSSPAYADYPTYPYGLMAGLFWPGHEMDYKSRYPGTGDFGNMNYGAVGSALGLSPYTLYNGAGIAQVIAGTQSPEFGIPFLSGNYGDDPDDTKMIEKGIRYYHDKQGKKK